MFMVFHMVFIHFFFLKTLDVARFLLGLFQAKVQLKEVAEAKTMLEKYNKMILGETEWSSGWSDPDLSGMKIWTELGPRVCEVEDLTNFWNMFLISSH